MEKLQVIKAKLIFEKLPSQTIEDKQVLIPVTAITALIPQGNNTYDVVFDDKGIRAAYSFAKIKSITATIKAVELQILEG